MYRKAFACAVVLGLVTSASPSLAFNVTLVQFATETSELLTRAVGDESGQDNEVTEPQGLPFVGSDQAQIDDTSTHTAYSFTNSGFSIVMVDHSWQAGWSESVGTIYFTVDEDITYTISGSYDGSNAGEIPVSILLSTNLTALSDETKLFESLQRSEMPLFSQESFEIGGQEGNQENELAGEQTGTLLANQLYRFQYDAKIGLAQEGTGPGEASGNVTISFVPEPSTGLLTALGLAGLGGIRRLRRR